MVAVDHRPIGGESLVERFIERFETLDDEEDTLRNGCVGSMFAVVETRPIGERGVPSN